MLGVCALAACSARGAGARGDGGCRSGQRAGAVCRRGYRHRAAGRRGTGDPRSPQRWRRTPFTLHETQPGVVDSIVISADEHPVQTLHPRENHVLPETGRGAAVDHRPGL